MKGIDTNLLVRLITQDDPEQFAKVQRFMIESEDRGGRLFINSIVLCEVVWALRSKQYGFRQEQIATTMERLLEIPLFEIAHRDVFVAALADYRSQGGDFADYFIGRWNSQQGCSKTVTFDRKLQSSELFESL